MRRTDPKAYWGKDVQAREQELIAAREKLQAGNEAPAQEQATAQDGAAGSNLPDELQDRWNNNGGIEANIKGARSRLILAFGEQGLESDDVQDLLASFDDELPDPVRIEIADQMSQDHGSAWPAATQEQVTIFAATEWGKALVETWGSKTAAHLGAAKREADSIMARLREQDRLRLDRWINSRTATQKRRAIEALAARATRKL